MTFTDEQLLQYSDGRLDADATNALRLDLEKDPALAERLRLMVAGGEALASEPEADVTGLDALAEAIRSGALDNRDAGDNSAALSSAHTLTHAPRRTADRATTTMRSSTWAPMQMAACLALLAVGLAGGYMAGSLNAGGEEHNAGQPTWVVRVVDYHTLYGRETVAGSRSSPEQRTKLEERFEAALDTRMHIPDLGSRKLDFRRGQVLRFRDQPVIQLAYLPDETGSPVALCLKPTGKSDSDPVYSEFRGMGVVRWRQSGLAYVLVGHRSKDDLLSDARKAVTEIRNAETI